MAVTKIIRPQTEGGRRKTSSGPKPPPVRRQAFSKRLSELPSRTHSPASSRQPDPWSRPARPKRSINEKYDRWIAPRTDVRNSQEAEEEEEIRRVREKERARRILVDIGFEDEGNDWEGTRYDPIPPSAKREHIGVSEARARWLNDLFRDRYSQDEENRSLSTSEDFHRQSGTHWFGMPQMNEFQPREFVPPKHGFPPQQTFLSPTMEPLPRSGGHAVPDDWVFSSPDATSTPQALRSRGPAHTIRGPQPFQPNQHIQAPSIPLVREILKNNRIQPFYPHDNGTEGQDLFDSHQVIPSTLREFPQVRFREYPQVHSLSSDWNSSHSASTVSNGHPLYGPRPFRSSQSTVADNLTSDPYVHLLAPQSAVIQSHSSYINQNRWASEPSDPSPISQPGTSLFATQMEFDQMTYSDEGRDTVAEQENSNLSFRWGRSSPVNRRIPTSLAIAYQAIVSTPEETDDGTEYTVPEFFEPANIQEHLDEEENTEMELDIDTVEDHMGITGGYTDDRSQHFGSNSLASNLQIPASIRDEAADQYLQEFTPPSSIAASDTTPPSPPSVVPLTAGAWAKYDLPQDLQQALNTDKKKSKHKKQIESKRKIEETPAPEVDIYPSQGNSEAAESIAGWSEGSPSQNSATTEHGNIAMEGEELHKWGLSPVLEEGEEEAMSPRERTLSQSRTAIVRNPEQVQGEGGCSSFGHEFFGDGDELGFRIWRDGY